jgi:hypothetical protein
VLRGLSLRCSYFFLVSYCIVVAMFTRVFFGLWSVIGEYNLTFFLLLVNLAPS